MEHEHGTSQMPPWAQKVDDIGKRYWYREKTLRNRRGEHIWGAVWNLFFLWLVNRVPDWNLAFINNHFNTILPLLSLNLCVQIAAHVTLIIFDVRWLRYFLKVITETSNFLTTLLIYFIYPFDFARVGHAWIDVMIPFLLIITMAVSAVSVLIHLFKLFFART